MTTSPRPAKFFACVAIAVGIAACSDDDPVVPDDPGTVPDSVEFDRHVQPIFNGRCAVSGCHVQPNPEADLVLSAGQAYANIVNVPAVNFPPAIRVTPFEPLNSILYLLVEDGDMPAEGPRLTSVQVAIIRKWIEDGAPDN